MTPKSQHIHKLKRIRYKSGNTIFFCALPDCSYKANIALSLGKRCVCWRCSTPFLLTEYSLRLAKPHCEACHQPKESVKEQIYQEELHEASKYEPEDLAERLEQITQEAQQQDEEI